MAVKRSIYCSDVVSLLQCNSLNQLLWFREEKILVIVSEPYRLIDLTTVRYRFFFFSRTQRVYCHSSHYVVLYATIPSTVPRRRNNACFAINNNCNNNNSDDNRKKKKNRLRAHSEEKRSEISLSIRARPSDDTAVAAAADAADWISRKKKRLKPMSGAKTNIKM